MIINGKQHNLIANPHITNDYKSALTISHFSLFHNGFSNLHTHLTEHKPWLGALNDWNVPGSWLHAFCLWLIKSYLLIRSSSSPFFRIPSVGCGKYATGFIKDINELNLHLYNSLWSKETRIPYQFTHPDNVFTKQTLQIPLMDTYLGLNMTWHICFRIVLKNIFHGFLYVFLNWPFPQKYHHQSQQATSEQNKTKAQQRHSWPPPNQSKPSKIIPSKKSTWVIKLNNSSLRGTKT